MIRASLSVPEGNLIWRCATVLFYRHSAWRTWWSCEGEREREGEGGRERESEGGGVAKGVSVC